MVEVLPPDLERVIILPMTGAIWACVLGCVRKFWVCSCVTHFGVCPAAMVGGVEEKPDISVKDLVPMVLAAALWGIF